MLIQLMSRQEIYDRSVEHLLERRRAMLDRNDGLAYQWPYGGCPVARLIRPVDFTAAMKGVQVDFLLAFAIGRTARLDTGIAGPRSALLRARVNVYDERTIALLSELQDVHYLSGYREWPDRLRSIARDYGLDCGPALGAHGQARNGKLWTFWVRWKGE
jgi:hypothetical protein